MHDPIGRHSKSSLKKENIILTLVLGVKNKWKQFDNCKETKSCHAIKERQVGLRCKQGRPECTVSPKLRDDLKDEAFNDEFDVNADEATKMVSRGALQRFF